MRRNEPVTQQEFDFPDNATLMSTTDVHGNILYANDAFVSISGFPREELVGQPHNLVRHPDMPKEAFADLWATIRQGLPWTSLVKNRRRNGDHYWVRANAVPVIRDGQAIGYMSVRTKPAREEVAHAEALYRDLREGRAGNRKLRRGIVVRTGWRSLLSLRQTMSIRARIRLSMAGVCLFVFASGTVLGAGGVGAWALAAVLAVAAAGGSVLLESMIARPLDKVLAQALGTASGANREVVYLDRTDEIGMIVRAISQLGLMFRWIIDDVSQQVLNLQTAATEISQGNDDLNSRTEQAAASVQETASSMEQMTASVRNNADTAQQADALAGTASAAASDGGRAVSQVVATMTDITASSRKIVDIIAVIDDIAFQTNILALNAAVEAARAGEHGRGFAVVAEEVRGLARRSAEAAKEIAALIGASVDKVEAGARIVDDAGRTMDKIVTQVKQVSDLIGDISTSSTEQSAGISRVGKAVSHLDDITQQNAALVEEGAAASESLKEQTARLVEAVSVFR